MQFHAVLFAALIILSKCSALMNEENTPPPTEATTSAISTEMTTISSLTGMVMSSNMIDGLGPVAIGYNKYFIYDAIVLVNTPLVNTLQMVGRNHE
jgi:hypothetical protein